MAFVAIAVGVEQEVAAKILRYRQGERLETGLRRADAQEFADTLEDLRERLDSWMEETDDKGRQPESAEMYDSDMATYTGTFKARKNDPSHLKVIEDNIALMKLWAAEGR